MERDKNNFKLTEIFIGGMLMIVSTAFILVIVYNNTILWKTPAEYIKKHHVTYIADSENKEDAQEKLEKFLDSRERMIGEAFEALSAYLDERNSKANENLPFGFILGVEKNPKLSIRGKYEDYLENDPGAVYLENSEKKKILERIARIENNIQKGYEFYSRTNYDRKAQEKKIDFFISASFVKEYLDFTKKYSRISEHDMRNFMSILIEHGFFKELNEGKPITQELYNKLLPILRSEVANSLSNEYGDKVVEYLMFITTDMSGGKIDFSFNENIKAYVDQFDPGVKKAVKSALK